MKPIRDSGRELMQKNKFALALREHLQAKYQINHHYTYGAGNFKAKEINGCYSLIHRAEDEPEDISGFCFRKDLCCAPFLFCSKESLLDDIGKFARENPKLNGIPKKDKKDKSRLEIEFGNKAYLVRPSVDEGYAEDISIYFHKMPDFSKRAVA